MLAFTVEYIRYAYRVGDRVRLKSGDTGCVVSCVPGNGRFGDEWYYVELDYRGETDRYQRQDIDGLA